MLRQLLLKAPMKGMLLKRSLTTSAQQIQNLAMVNAALKEQQGMVQSTPGRYVSQLFYKMAPQIITNTSLTLGISKLRIQLPIFAKIHNFGQYNASQDPLDEFQTEQSQLCRSNIKQNGHFEKDGEPSNGMEQGPADVGYVDQNLKDIGTNKPLPEPKITEEPARKVPYHNPLRRRNSVDPARLQYIKDRFKNRNVEHGSLYRAQGKKHISRTALHSGRMDKIE